jgi:hypothetical protein
MQRTPIPDSRNFESNSGATSGRFRVGGGDQKLSTENERVTLPLAASLATQLHGQRDSGWRAFRKLFQGVFAYTPQWRWRESNPRLPSSCRGFSERSRWESLGPPSVIGLRRRSQPECDVPPGPRASPGGEPLCMTSTIRPSGWAGMDALLSD